GFANLAAVSQTYQVNHWYRIEVDWNVGGSIVGRLFDSNGTTLLKTVKATTNVITSGGIAFRAFGHDKYWDTVAASPVSSVISSSARKHADDSNGGAPAGDVNSDSPTGSLGSAPSQSRGILLVTPGFAALVQAPSVAAPQISFAAAEPLAGRAQAVATISNETLPSISRTAILLSGSSDQESANATERTDDATPILETAP